jgi:hypothetical protein
MLPFLKKKEDVTSPGLIVKTRMPDKTEENQDTGSEGMHSAAQDLLSAIESKDTKAIASALKAAFDIADSQPHEEGAHTNES